MFLLYNLVFLHQQISASSLAYSHSTIERVQSRKSPVFFLQKLALTSCLSTTIYFSSIKKKGVVGIFFKKLISFIFNFLFHNSHDIFDRQIIVLNKINQIESWRKHRCCAWVRKRVCHHQGSNSWPRSWHSVQMIRALCDTTQLFRRPQSGV